MHRTPRLMSLCAVSLAVLATPGGASQVIPMSLAELIGAADLIVRARVVDRRSERITTRDGPAIMTLVTCRIDRTLKGEPRAQIPLEFLGGVVGDEALRVSGMPRFQVGDRAVLFLDTGARTISPIVGLMQGRFPITTSADGSRQYVTTYDGRAFSAVAQIGVPASTSATPVPTMSLEAFEAAVIRQVRDRENRPR